MTGSATPRVRIHVRIVFLSRSSQDSISEAFSRARGRYLERTAVATVVCINNKYYTYTRIIAVRTPYAIYIYRPRARLARRLRRTVAQVCGKRIARIPSTSESHHKICSIRTTRATVYDVHFTFPFSERWGPIDRPDEPNTPCTTGTVDFRRKRFSRGPANRTSHAYGLTSVKPSRLRGGARARSVAPRRRRASAVYVCPLPPPPILSR